MFSFSEAGNDWTVTLSFRNAHISSDFIYNNCATQSFILWVQKAHRQQKRWDAGVDKRSRARGAISLLANVCSDSECPLQNMPTDSSDGNVAVLYVYTLPLIVELLRYKHYTGDDPVHLYTLTVIVTFPFIQRNVYNLTTLTHSKCITYTQYYHSIYNLIMYMQHI